VTLIGLGNHFELWDQTKYADFEARELANGLPPEAASFTF
jgi:DNA-binding transcriptional regulator/RsmH inhibitor MraZ